MQTCYNYAFFCGVRCSTIWLLCQIFVQRFVDDRFLYQAGWDLCAKSLHLKFTSFTYIYLYIIDIIHLLHILYIHTSFIHCLYIHSFNIYNLHQLAPCIVNVEAWMPFCPQCGGRLLLRMGSSVHWFVGSFFHTEVKELRATDEFYKTSMCSGPLGPLGPLRHAMQWVHEHCAWKR